MGPWGSGKDFCFLPPALQRVAYSRLVRTGSVKVAGYRWTISRPKINFAFDSSCLLSAASEPHLLSASCTKKPSATELTAPPSLPYSVKCLRQSIFKLWSAHQRKSVKITAGLRNGVLKIYYHRLVLLYQQLYAFLKCTCTLSLCCMPVTVSVYCQSIQIRRRLSAALLTCFCVLQWPTVLCPKKWIWFCWLLRQRRFSPMRQWGCFPYSDKHEDQV